MKNLIFIINIIISIIVIFLILIQGKGAGLGSAWGGGGELFQTRRGIEKVIFRLTILLIILFYAFSLLIFLKK